MSLPEAALYLASRSPRRLELLGQLGLAPHVIVADVDESAYRNEPPVDYVRRIATAKARAGWTHVGAGLAAGVETSIQRPGVAARLIAADTAVVVEEQLLGKPTDAEDALRMLALLSDRTHQVYTAVSFLVADAGTMARPAEQNLLCRTEVKLRAISTAEALAYWASGEPRDKAGGYGIQGLGALFVERVHGSYSNVVGLPLFETAALLQASGMSLLRPSSGSGPAVPDRNGKQAQPDPDPAPRGGDTAAERETKYSVAPGDHSQ